MIDLKATPGPWGVYGDFKDLRIRDAKNLDTVIAQVSNWSDEFAGEREANAHLIAAAPEMYALLEELNDGYDIGSVMSDAIDRLLAKARGEA